MNRRAMHDSVIIAAQWTHVRHDKRPRAQLQVTFVFQELSAAAALFDHAVFRYTLLVCVSSANPRRFTREVVRFRYACIGGRSRGSIDGPSRRAPACGRYGLAR